MKRVFHPGEEWFYLRLYAGPDTADKYLANSLPGLIKDLKRDHLIKKFFYLRYSDPSFHLRLRFDLSNPDYFGRILKIFRSNCEDIYKDGFIWKTEIGTYQREIERYGQDWIEMAEMIFSVDSEFWLDILPYLRDAQNGEDKRWQAALLSVNGVFQGFGIKVKDRIKLLKKMVDSLSAEIDGSKKLRYQIDEKFRINRIHLEGIMINPGLTEIPDLTKVLKRRSMMIKDIPFLIENSDTWSEVVMQNRISDIIHLSMNRGLRSKHRMQELIIYTFLKQLYISQEARN